MHIHQDTINNVPFLRNKDPNLVVALVMMLRLQFYAPGDVVVRQDETGDTMLFVTRGSLEVRSRMTTQTPRTSGPGLHGEAFRA